MSALGDWPLAPLLRSERLVLEPLRVEHAAEMAPLLADARLYELIGGGEGPSPEDLEASYRGRLSAGGADGSRWCNWVVRSRESDAVVGGVQAEVTSGEQGVIAELAWIVGSAHQRRGYAREAAAAMADWLRERGALVLVAEIHEHNVASIRVALALGLAVTTESAAHDGDVRWAG